jgi:hypothetical protein
MQSLYFVLFVVFLRWEYGEEMQGTSKRESGERMKRKMKPGKSLIRWNTHYIRS